MTFLAATRCTPSVIRKPLGRDTSREGRLKLSLAPGVDTTTPCWRSSRPQRASPLRKRSLPSSLSNPPTLLVHSEHRRVGQVANDQRPPRGVWKPAIIDNGRFGYRQRPCIADLELLRKASNEIPARPSHFRPPLAPLGFCRKPRRLKVDPNLFATDENAARPTFRALDCANRPRRPRSVSLSSVPVTGELTNGCIRGQGLASRCAIGSG